MKDERGLKRTLEELKRQINGLTYYVENIRPRDNDRASQANINHARSTLQSIEHTMRTKLEPFQRELSTSIQAEADDNFMKSLGSINSPDNDMVKNAEDIMKVKQSVVGKKDILKQAREGMIKNIKSSIQNLKKRAQYANQRKNNRTDQEDTQR